MTTGPSVRPRFAILGAGFWARFQLAAWCELGTADCVAIYNRTRSRAERLAAEFHVPAVYDDPAALLDHQAVDFVDVITSPDTHAALVELARERGLPVICQKPMATSLDEAVEMVQACAEARVPFFVHENFRWQRAVREAKAVLDAGTIGRPFRARLEFTSSFPVFENQPFLRDLREFILTDVGSHMLDMARFLFGEVEALYCQIERVHPAIRGEDVATVLLRTAQGTTVVCEMSFASRLEDEAFPETLLRVEGSAGSLELKKGHWVRVTTAEGTLSRRVEPARFSWSDPSYDVVQDAIVRCNQNLLGGITGSAPAETTGEDNLRTVRLVFGSYTSARTDAVFHPPRTRGIARYP